MWWTNRSEVAWILPALRGILSLEFFVKRIIGSCTVANAQPFPSILSDQIEHISICIQSTEIIKIMRKKVTVAYVCEREGAKR